jgi:saccharopine dehydrogenase-like NADP-dependent oxidoreductase
MAGKILIIGLGELGYHILQELAHTPMIGKIIAADCTPDGERKTNIEYTQRLIEGFILTLNFV